MFFCRLALLIFLHQAMPMSEICIPFSDNEPILRKVYDLGRP
jgi:hypothetical protein